jgi:glucose-1-phosphate thymidylyltransferase
VLAFEEKPRSPKSTLVSTGVSLLPAPHLPLLVEFAKTHPDNIGGVFEEYLRRGIPVEFRAYTEPWFDIGSFESYLEATRVLVGERLLLGPDASSRDTQTEGSVVLGRKSVVRGSTLRNVILFEHCTVEDCVLEDCILDDHCTLRGIDLRRQMLREGTVLEREEE